MAGDREERLMMRQRGAGRQIKDLEFDLVLPGQSTSPLKPQKSGRARQTPQFGLPSRESPRPTPKQAGTPARTRNSESSEAGLDGLSGSKGDDDILGSNPTANRGKTINSRKRKLDRAGGSEEPTTKKKRRPAQNPRKEGKAALQKDGIREAKSIIPAPSRSALAHMGNTTPEEDTANEDQATSHAETVKVGEKGTKIPHKIVDRAAKAGQAPKLQRQPDKLSKKRTRNPEEKDLIIAAEPAEDLVDHEVIDEKEPAPGERASVMAPVKKRRKRKAIGRLLTKRARQPTHVSPQKTASSRSNHSTSDLINELLDSTIDSSPKKPTKDPQHARNPVHEESSKAIPSTSGPALERNHPTKSTSIVSKPATTVSEQTAKSKPKKRRRSITQAKKPRKRLAVETKPQNEVPPRAPVVDAESNRDTIASNIDAIPTGNHTRRNPLSNITNSIPDPVVARTETDSTDSSTPDSAAVKRKGRPRKSPTAKNERSKSQTLVTKSDTKPRSAAALPTRPKTVLNKISKASANKPIKAPKSSTSVTVHAATGALVDDPALDSDDPLSGPSNVRFKKTFRIPSENIQLTPQRKGPENGGKRKELEQKEIEMLLGSIGKGVKSGRAMAS